MKTILIKLLKSPVFWLSLAVIDLAITCSIQRRNITEKGKEVARLTGNQTTLLSQIEYHKSRNNELVASVQALTLKRDELAALIPAYESEIKSLKIELKNVRSISHIETEMNVDVTVPVPAVSVPESPVIVPKTDESVPAGEKKQDYPIEFSWRDDWTEICGKIYADSVSCVVTSRDSLLLVSHYEKKKCLFKRKGKLIKYDVRSKNPHVTIKGVELVDVIEE